MSGRSLGILICWGILATTLAGLADDRLGVEHRVTEDDAKAAAKTLTPELMVGIGCKNCSSSELTYCSSQDVIEDHCCCDRRFHEVFPYIPHTCYLRARPCALIAPHCGEFARLVLCCCHRLLASKWKDIADSSESVVPEFYLITTALIISMTPIGLFQS